MKSSQIKCKHTNFSSQMCFEGNLTSDSMHSKYKHIGINFKTPWKEVVKISETLNLTKSSLPKEMFTNVKT